MSISSPHYINTLLLNDQVKYPLEANLNTSPHIDLTDTSNTSQNSNHHSKLKESSHAIKDYSCERGANLKTESILDDETTCNNSRKINSDESYQLSKIQDNFNVNQNDYSTVSQTEFLKRDKILKNEQTLFSEIEALKSKTFLFVFAFSRTHFSYIIG